MILDPSGLYRLIKDHLPGGASLIHPSAGARAGTPRLTALLPPQILPTFSSSAFVRSGQRSLRTTARPRRNHGGGGTRLVSRAPRARIRSLLNRYRPPGHRKTRRQVYGPTVVDNALRWGTTGIDVAARA